MEGGAIYGDGEHGVSSRRFTGKGGRDDESSFRHFESAALWDTGEKTSGGQLDMLV